MYKLIGCKFYFFVIPMLKQSANTWKCYQECHGYMRPWPVEVEWASAHVAMWGQLVFMPERYRYASCALTIKNGNHLTASMCNSLLDEQHKNESHHSYSHNALSWRLHRSLSLTNKEYECRIICWVRYKRRIYILNFTFLTDPNVFNEYWKSKELRSLSN